MAAHRENPSGPGQVKRLAMEAAQAISAGESVTTAVKTASLKQLSAIMAFACSKGGFPTVNRHLYLDQFAGLGWLDLQPLIADRAQGEEVLKASVAALEYYGATAQYVSEYKAIIKQALNGEANDMLRQARKAGHVPTFLAYERVKEPVPEGRRREPKTLMYYWQQTVVFPDAPVFHAQPLFSPELASVKNLKLHVVGAVYGAKLAWAEAHGGQEPPAHVVDAWGPLQASHLMEGPIGLRRNWNHRFLTLESEWGNKHRHSCAAALLRVLAINMLPPDVSTVTLEHLEESQATGSQPQEGELSLVEGNSMLLSEMFNEEDEIESLCKDINADICDKLHPHAPCKFWNKSYGAVPDAVSKVPINDSVLFKSLLVWPPEPESGGLGGEPPAKRVLEPFDWDLPKNVSQARQKLLFVEREIVVATAAIDAKGEPRTAHPTLNRLRQRKHQVKITIKKLQEKEDALGGADADP